MHFLIVLGYFCCCCCFKQLAWYFDQKSEGFLEEHQHTLRRFLPSILTYPFISPQGLPHGRARGQDYKGEGAARMFDAVLQEEGLDAV